MLSEVLSYPRFFINEEGMIAGVSCAALIQVTQAPELQPHIFWLAFKVDVQGVGCILESDKETDSVCMSLLMTAVLTSISGVWTLALNLQLCQ